MVQIHQETERSRGPDVIINCPACGEYEVPAITYDEQIRESLAGLVPVNSVHRSWVACSSCKTPVRSRLRAAELEGKTPIELADLIYVDASFLHKCLAIIALIVAVFPLVGTVVASVALFANRKLPVWPKTVSIVALGLSFLPLVFFAGGLVLAMLGVIK